MSSNSDDTSQPESKAESAVSESATESAVSESATESAVSESATESAVSEAAASDGSAKPEVAKDAPKAPAKDRFWYWVVGIAALLCIELFIYGRDGLIEVCVGVEGVTDFSLKGQPRTKENVRKLPQCTVRLNLGMYNNSEELAKGALLDACGRATMTNRDELPNCMTREKKWTRRVTKTQVAPWDSRLYRRLLWLD